MGNNTKTVVKGRLTLAMKFAITGSSIAVLGALISFFLSLSLKKEYVTLGHDKAMVSAFLSTMIANAFIGILWTCTFAALAPLLKRMKSRALAINFIIFSALGFIVWLFGLTLPIILDMYLSGGGNVASTYPTLETIDPVFSHLRQLEMFSVLPGYATICGWALMFTAGIIGVSAKKEEFTNNKIKNG